METNYYVQMPPVAEYHYTMVPVGKANFELTTILANKENQIAEANKILDNSPHNLGIEGEKFYQRLREALK